MKKEIISVGIDLASEEVAQSEIESRQSLLDWDIVLFRPDISPFIHSYADSYQGKPCLDDTRSFNLKECLEHWRREILQAVESGKTVIVFVSDVQEVFVATGDKSYSGTGRNRHTTRIVVPITNHASLPVNLKGKSSVGAAMKLTAGGVEALSHYWKGFGACSSYKLIFGEEVPGIAVTTKAGDKPVGALVRKGRQNGALLLLPDLEFCPDDFLEETDGEMSWTDEAKKFASKFIAAIVEIDRCVRSTGDLTPEPAWASAEQYSSDQEVELRRALLDAEMAVEAAQKHKERISVDLYSAGSLRSLLYEKGKPLELTIVQALRLLGFSAEQYRDGESEFDVVFESEEGRLIGEAEGKDTKAVNVDKLRQLSMNVHEDLARDEVASPAKGVLFGNGYRLVEPSERPSQFTEKCISAAAIASVALVCSSDLYRVALALTNNYDDDYAAECRSLIISTNGIVKFPER